LAAGAMCAAASGASRMNSTSSESIQPAPRAMVIGAFLIVYVVWGSTYLGIKIAIETLPPLTMAGLRFVIAGGLLYLLLRARGHRIDATAWGNAAIVGTALLAGGNGGVTWAERTVPSGIAALVIGSVPLWFSLI